MLIPGIRRKEHTVSDEREKVESEKVDDDDFEGHRWGDPGRVDDEGDVGRYDDDGKVEPGRVDSDQVDVD